MAKLTGISLGGVSSVSAKSSLQLTQESFILGANQDGIYGVQFTCTDDGRGTGGQFVPLDRLEDFCNSLEKYADPESLKGKSAATDAVTVMEATMAYVDEDVAPGQNIRVAFRTQLGQGQKPTRVNQTEIPAIVEYLRGQIAPSQAAVAKVVAAKKKA